MLSALASLFRARRQIGDGPDNRLDAIAVPGLMTLLDVALFRTYEGELTSTLTTSHMLLAATLDLKQQAIVVLNEVKYERPSNRRTQLESFARACLEGASDMVERLSIERLAQSANLSDPFESLSSSTSSTASQHVFSSSPVDGLEDSFQDTARRRPLHQRPRDCWESPRLYCLDYVWADETAGNCQRLLRHLYKHPFLSETTDTNPTLSESAKPKPLSLTLEQEASILVDLLQVDLPTRLVQFRTATEAESVVSKRLYLVKCEYRAPFRAFLEAHQSVLRAPPLELIDDSLGKKSAAQSSAKNELQALLETPELLEALSLEQRCEEYEADMARAIFPFCELARYLDHKRARVKVVPGITDDEDDLVDLSETLRRLKGLLCRKTSPDTTAGIRPLLLDLQGVPRDDELDVAEPDLNSRLERLVDELETLARLSESRNAFAAERRADVDVPSSIVRGCTQFDCELFSCQFQDWLAMVERQHELTKEQDFDDLADRLRRAEMQVSLSVASKSSLEMVRERVQMITADRAKRFELLKEMIEEVCAREMDLHIDLKAPRTTQPLALPSTSALGIFGLPLQMAGESLPIG